MEWTIQDLGALGEFIGAFAVVITLIYLAVQLRQNTQSLKLNVEKDIAIHIAQVNYDLASTSVSHVLIRAAADISQLNDEEMAQFGAFANGFFRTHQLAHDQWLDGNLSRRSWESIKSHFRTQMASAGIKAFWDVRSPTFKPEFRDYVSGLDSGGVLSSAEVMQALKNPKAHSPRE